MNADPIDRLVREHRIVEGILDQVEAALTGGGATPPEAETIAAVRHHIGRLWPEFYHHSLQREEQMLFPLLASLAPPGQGPVAVMRQEHRLMAVGFRTILAPDSSTADVVRSALVLCQVLRAHIQKEDGVLFPMAAQRLTPGQLETIGDRFTEYDDASPPAPSADTWLANDHGP